MKKLISLFLTLCIAASVSGCGNRGGDVGGVKPVTIRVVTSFGADDGNRRYYEAAVQEYESATGNTVIDNSDTSNEEWKVKVLTDFETGSEPDVLFFFTDADAEPFIRAGKVVPLSEIRSEYPDYACNMDEKKLPAASDGECYAVPVMGYWEYLYVNTSVLKAAGVEVPGPDYTWAQFIEDCRTIKEHGFTPIACSLAEVSHYWFEFAVMNNGSAEDHLVTPSLDENGRLVNDEVAAKWISALEDIKYLYEQGFFPADTLTAGDSKTAAMFGEGEAAFLLDGSWKVGYFTENYPDKLRGFAVRYVPAKGRRMATETIGGISAGFFITRRAWDDTEKRAAAVEFVRRLTSDDVIGSFVTTETTALKKDPAPMGLDPLQQSAAEARAGTTLFIGAVQDHISGEARASLFGNIRNVVTGKMTAREAVETAMRLN